MMDRFLPPVISDEISIVNGEVGCMCPTWLVDSPGSRVVSTDSGGTTIEHDKRGCESPQGLQYSEPLPRNLGDIHELIYYTALEMDRLPARQIINGIA